VRELRFALAANAANLGFYLRVLLNPMRNEVFAPPWVSRVNGTGENPPAELDGFVRISFHRDPLSFVVARCATP